MKTELDRVCQALLETSIELQVMKKRSRSTYEMGVDLVKEPNDAVKLTCLICNTEFAVCRSCWRGQKCCSKECSLLLKNINQRARQKKYQATEKGLELGRLRQRRRYNKNRMTKSSH